MEPVEDVDKKKAAIGWRQAFMASPGPRKWQDSLILFIKGVCMGVADIIPGVSGGTIAFISGIYEALVNSIASFDAVFVKRIFTFRWKEALTNVHLRFFLNLYIGVSLAIFSTASLMQYLMDKYSVLTWAGFFGLIGGSILIVYREVTRWSVWRGVLLLAGVTAAWYICGMIPVSTPDDLWFIFLCGVIGICAMILPGISGSFMLLVLGKYYTIITSLQIVIEAVKKAVGFDFAGAYLLLAQTGSFWILVVFSCGQIFGIVGFSRVLKWLLARWHEGTMCVLAGLMIGAMRKIWPWKHTLTLDEHHGKLRVLSEQLVWPWDYAQPYVAQMHIVDGGKAVQTVEKSFSGQLPQTGAALLLMGIGFAMVILLEHFARGKKDSGSALN